MPVAITALYAGILALLLVALAVNVTMHRNRLGVTFGDGAKPEMMRMIRVHGNSVEYVPIGVVLMGLYELNHGLPVALHVTGIALIVSRLIYVAGIWNSDRPTAGRGIGIVLTWATIVALAVLNFWQISGHM
jgi:uncharacterized protein